MLHQEHSLQIRWHSIVLFSNAPWLDAFLSPIHVLVNAWNISPDVFSPPPLTLPVVVLFVFENIPAFLSEIFPSIPAFSSDESCAPLLQQATFFSSSSLQDS